jgi:ATP-dependent DNA helicase RecQ
VGASALPGGLLILKPNDPSFGGGAKGLLLRLARAGIEQFIVPESLAGEAARTLVECCELGLILSAEAMIGPTRLAGLPTALLLPQGSALGEFLIPKMRAVSERWPDLPIVLVAEPDRTVDGRRLDQTASNSAPIHEDLLDQLIVKDCKAA